MKKTHLYMAGLLLSAFTVLPLGAQTPQQETLSRGVVAVKTSSGVFVSWRYLGTDSPSAKFNVYRDGELLNSSPLTDVTNYTDAGGTTSSTYVVTRVSGTSGVESSAETAVWDNFYKKIALNRPPSGVTPAYTATNDGTTEEYPNGQYYSYTPNDCSVGDVDGDGEYEIIVKWDPTNSRDNSYYGYTGEVYLDCYKLDGTQLWRINLGKNIRAGAHYSPFMVYDLDGDGKAEVACKTAPGTIDGQGNYVLMEGDSETDDYRNSNGMIIKGSEYLTLFNGETGAEITTIAYNPPRVSASNWGDSYGNRSERYLACIAYLDGINPSLVMCRGYYSRAVLVAYDFDGTTLTQRWIHDSPSSGIGAYGEGNHNLSVGDVDEDGCDEIIYGACAIDHDGSLLYRTGLGHGDAIHLSDMDPDIRGLEVFDIHEETTAKYGYEMHKAGTGEILFGDYTGSDVGRGCAADIDANYRGQESWTTEGGIRDCKGNTISGSRPSMNFRLYWDGDLQDELLDGTTISKWSSSQKKASTLIELSSYAQVSSCNSTKQTPCLSADLFGDWREEVILWDTSDSASLVLYTTTTPSDYRLPTLMHDHTYRMGIAWQNVGYNQPPHLGYYIGDGDIESARLTKISEGSRSQTVGVHMPIDTVTFRWDRCDGVEISRLPSGIYSRYKDSAKTISIYGTPSVSGDYTIVISTEGNPVANPTDTVFLEILPEDDITAVALYRFDESAGSTAANAIYGEAVASGFTPEWDSGMSGNGILFPETADETSVLTQDSYSELEAIDTQSFTISLWIKTENGDQSILDIEGEDGSFIRIERNSRFSFSICDGTTTTSATARSTTTLFNGEWNYLVCIRDRSDEKLYVYLNGSLMTQATDKCGDLSLSQIAIGNREEEGTYLSYRGMMDNLTISTGAMNDRQVNEAYSATEEVLVDNTPHVNVYPTRFADQLHIQLSQEAKNVSIQLYNQVGSLMLERVYDMTGNPLLTISGLDNLPSGIYLLRINNGNTQETVKLLKR
ncbi:MAG: T9SS type A sorting domain-containing protein [Porphyromonadaceae bacterium]|nr:T9SS type A sorting domain-containing protein [Porphyromonadaceae bacterium]